MMDRFFKTWRKFTITEGGNKSVKTKNTVLSPELVKRAVAVYEEVITDWGRWLQEQGKEPVKPLRPVGSVSYYEKDLEEKPGTVYGDIDYLVEFPYSSEADDDTSKRKGENAFKREYTQLFVDYLNSGDAHSSVDVQETLLGNVLMVILEIAPGVYVQADTVVTFPEYSDWMSGRYTPQRGLKGYTMGRLFSALGGYFPLSIGTEGVIARTQDGKLVTGKVRKNVEIQTVSTKPQTFLIDIARYFAGDDVGLDPVLRQNSGVDPENVSIEQFARGIKGLANTLDAAGLVDRDEMVSTVTKNYQNNLQAQADDQMKWAGRREAKMREEGASESEIRAYMKDEQKTHQKLLNLNGSAFDLFRRGIGS